MDENSQEMYLQNLEEFVLDEDKIVTYKWLSKTLNIHVNQSKQLLYTFCSSKDRQTSVSATYLLAGRLRSTGENRITVVGQDKYEDAKSAFETLSSEHVYSIQKTKQTLSGSTLFTADSQPVDGDCIASRGAIRCKDSVRRAAEELALLRVTVPPPAPPSVSKSVKAAPSSSKEPEKKSPAKAKPDEAANEDGKKEAKPKGGLASMFAAQTSKASTKPAAAAAASTSKNNAKGKKGSGISNFFSKVSKEELEENEKAEKVKVEKAKALKEKESSPAKVEEEDVMEVDSADEESKPSSPPVTAKQGNKKTDSESKNKTKNSSKPAKQTKRSKTKEKKDEPKKRKRIVTQDSDSSDQDIFEEEKNPSSREASPEPVLRAKALESDEDEDIIPPTPVAESSNGRVRRRRKVTKDKTFLDESGYMVTQKVNEYESFSESDTENADTKRSKGASKAAETVDKDKDSSPTASKGKNAKGKAAKKTSPVTTKSPLKSKQQSLMSFFKKKD